MAVSSQPEYSDNFITIFHKTVVEDDWTYHSVVSAPNNGQNDDGIGFGSSVAIDGTFMAVGAPLNAPSIFTIELGKVLIYEYDSDQDLWEFAHTISPTARDFYLHFGYSLALKIDATPSESGLLVIGNSNDLLYYSTLNDDHTWTSVQPITYSDTYSANGPSLDIEGQWLAVGGPSSTSSQGVVMLFDLSQSFWYQAGETQAITSPAPAYQNLFGTSVALSGGDHPMIAVAEYADVSCSMYSYVSNAGQVHVFSLSGDMWSFQATLSDSTPTAEARFGSSLAAGPGRVAAGRIADEDTDNHVLSFTYLEDSDTWMPSAPYTPQHDDNYHFGEAVALDGAYVFVGSPNLDSLNTANVYQIGGVYMWELPAQTIPELTADVSTSITSTCQLGAIYARLLDVSGSPYSGFDLSGYMQGGWGGERADPMPLGDNGLYTAQTTSPEDDGQYTYSVYYNGTVIGVSQMDLVSGMDASLSLLLHPSTAVAGAPFPVHARPWSYCDEYMTQAKLTLTVECLTDSEWMGLDPQPVPADYTVSLTLPEGEYQLVCTDDAGASFSASVSVITASPSDPLVMQPSNRTEGASGGTSISLNDEWMAVGASSAVLMYLQVEGVWLYHSSLYPDGIDPNAHGDIVTLSQTDSVMAASYPTMDSIFTFRFNATSDTWTPTQRLTLWDKLITDVIILQDNTILASTADSQCIYTSTYTSYYGEDEWGSLTSTCFPGASLKEAAFTELPGTDEGESWVVIGAPHASVVSMGNAEGVVYCYNQSGADLKLKSPAQVLTSPYSSIGYSFGNAVAMDSDNGQLIVAENNATVDSIPNAGQVHVFSLSGDTWSFQATLSDSTPTAEARFGSSLAAGPGRVAAGRIADEGTDNHVLSFTYLEDSDTWMPSAPYTPQHDDNYHFGEAVALDGAYVFVGSPNLDSLNTANVYQIGGVYMWELPAQTIPELTADVSTSITSTCQLGAIYARLLDVSGSPYSGFDLSGYMQGGWGGERGDPMPLGDNGLYTAQTTSPDDDGQYTYSVYYNGTVIGSTVRDLSDKFSVDASLLTIPEIVYMSDTFTVSYTFLSWCGAPSPPAAGSVITIVDQPISSAGSFRTSKSWTQDDAATSYVFETEFLADIETVTVVSVSLDSGTLTSTSFFPCLTSFTDPDGDIISISGTLSTIDTPTYYSFGDSISASVLLVDSYGDAITRTQAGSHLSMRVQLGDDATTSSECTATTVAGTDDQLSFECALPSYLTPSEMGYYALETYIETDMVESTFLDNSGFRMTMEIPYHGDYLHVSGVSVVDTIDMSRPIPTCTSEDLYIRLVDENVEDILLADLEYYVDFGYEIYSSDDYSSHTVFEGSGELYSSYDAYFITDDAVSDTVGTYNITVLLEHTVVTETTLEFTRQPDNMCIVDVPEGSCDNLVPHDTVPINITLRDTCGVSPYSSEAVFVKIDVFDNVDRTYIAQHAATFLVDDLYQYVFTVPDNSEGHDYSITFDIENADYIIYSDLRALDISVPSVDSGFSFWYYFWLVFGVICVIIILCNGRRIVNYYKRRFGNDDDDEPDYRRKERIPLVGQPAYTPPVIQPYASTPQVPSVTAPSAPAPPVSVPVTSTISPEFGAASGAVTQPAADVPFIAWSPDTTGGDSTYQWTPAEGVML